MDSSGSFSVTVPPPGRCSTTWSAHRYQHQAPWCLNSLPTSPGAACRVRRHAEPLRLWVVEPMSAKSCLGEWNAAPQQQGLPPAAAGHTDPSPPPELSPSRRGSNRGRRKVLVLAGPHYLTLVTVEV